MIKIKNRVKQETKTKTMTMIVKKILIATIQMTHHVKENKDEIRIYNSNKRKFMVLMIRIAVAVFLIMMNIETKSKKSKMTRAKGNKLGLMKIETLWNSYLNKIFSKKPNQRKMMILMIANQMRTIEIYLNSLTLNT